MTILHGQFSSLISLINSPSLLPWETHCQSFDRAHMFDLDLIHCKMKLIDSKITITTQVSQYQKRHSPTHAYPGHQSSLICFFHLLRSMASSLFNLNAWQSFSTISVQVFFGLPLGLAPSTSYSIHFFTQSLPSFRSTCPYHHNLFCCSTEMMSSNPSLSVNPLLGTLSCSLTPHIHLTILISAVWSATSFSFLMG